MEKKKNSYDDFYKILSEDVSLAKNKVDEDPSEFHKREFVRTTFSAIEALNWKIKSNLIEEISSNKKVSPHEIAALKEETYSINNNGELQIRPKGYSLITGFRLIFYILKKYGVIIETCFGAPSWQNLEKAIKIRNRLVHPKSTSDIIISSDDIETCHKAFIFIINSFHTLLLAPIMKILSDFGTNLSKEENEKRQITIKIE